MAFRVNITGAAKSDLIEILDYIAADNPARAVSFVDELQRRTKSILERLPKSGRVYRDATRYIVVANYVVLYDIEDAKKTVNVLHIFAPGRNWREVV